MQCTECHMVVSENEIACQICGGRALPSIEDLLGGGAYQLYPEVRQAQVEAAELVEKAIQKGKNAVVEAGVGTGKSAAYIIPALLGERRTVIATNSKNLQSQLIKTDIPRLQEKLAPLNVKFDVKIAKGKSNFICGSAVELLKAKKKFSNALVTFAEDAAAGAHSGDKDELLDVPAEWELISAENCMGKSCQYFNKCGYIQQRKAVGKAQLVIANHAFLASDMYRNRKDGLTPFPTLSTPETPIHTLVVDEAHKLPEWVRKAFELTLRPGALSRIESFLESDELSEAGAGQYTKQFHEGVSQLFRILPSLTKYKPTLRLTDQDVAKLAPLLAPLSKALTGYETPYKLKRTGHIARWSSLSPADRRDVLLLQRAQFRLDKVRDALQRLDSAVVAAMTSTPQSANTVAYLQATDGRDPELVLTPVSVAPLLRAQLYPYTKTNIYMSATLAEQGNFNAVKSEFGLDPQTATLKLDSPFDYTRQAVLYAPNNPALVPPRGTDGDIARINWYSAVAGEIERLVSLTAGRTFVLFTARTDLNAVRELLARTEMNLLVADESTTPGALTVRYREDAQAGKAPVLLGLKSFWEGVSIEGEDLVSVILPKLPFPVPSDPIIEAQMAQYKDPHVAYRNVMVSAMLRDLKQGTGRLIRSAKDYGIVSILDARIWTKYQAYGRLILGELPFKNFKKEYANAAQEFREIAASF